MAQARAGTPDGAWEREAIRLQVSVQHRPFRKGQMVSELQEG